jgi:hypothetical protein
VRTNTERILPSLDRPGHGPSGWGRDVVGAVTRARVRRCTVKMRRIVHSLGWLAALVMAVSAGWKAW